MQSLYELLAPAAAVAPTATSTIVSVSTWPIVAPLLPSLSSYRIGFAPTRNAVGSKMIAIMDTMVETTMACNNLVLLVNGTSCGAILVVISLRAGVL